MDAFFDALGKWIKTFLHFLSNLYHYFSTKWHDEQLARQQYQNAMHRDNVSQMLLEELFLILKNSPYDCFNKIFCIDNIICTGWTEHDDEIFYHYDIYCSDPPNGFALEQIRQKLNIAIAQCQRRFIQQFGHEQTILSYPCIYHGMYLSSIKADGTMIHIEIVSHLSHITP